MTNILSRVLGDFLIQTHTGKLFSKCITDRPFHPVPSLLFSLFSPSQTDDIKIYGSEEWDSSVLQIPLNLLPRTGQAYRRRGSGEYVNPAHLIGLILVFEL